MLKIYEFGVAELQYSVHFQCIRYFPTVLIWFAMMFHETHGLTS
jgi:hypothetical protein